MHDYFSFTLIIHFHLIPYPHVTLNSLSCSYALQLCLPHQNSTSTHRTEVPPPTHQLHLIDPSLQLFGVVVCLNHLPRHHATSACHISMSHQHRQVSIARSAPPPNPPITPLTLSTELRNWPGRTGKGLSPS